MEPPKRLKPFMTNLDSIKLVITDFDGTLADTCKANLWAYKKAFEFLNIPFSDSLYKDNFGVRFDELMTAFKIDDAETRLLIKKHKAGYYSKSMDLIKINSPLLTLLKFLKKQQVTIALATTASRTNVSNVLKHFHLEDFFDLLICGEDVNKGKPAPDVYQKVLENANLNAAEAIAFEDSEIGCQAAMAAGIQCIKIQVT